VRRLSPPAVHLFLGAILAGCATTGGGRLPELGTWEQRKDVLSVTDEYEFSGRIGVRAGSDGFNGKIWWRQDGIVYRARISGPIGVGTVFVNGDGREVTLTDRDGVTTELDDAERDLRGRYGWTIPVTSLRYWALGVPDPSSPADVDIDERGLMNSLEQGGWRVTIGEYAEGGGQSMPRRLTAVSGDIRVRLIVDEWGFR
jgi:outer membrane lipoprotein LolB